MIQRLVRVGGARNRLHQDRQNADELMPLMRLAGHRLQIAVSLFDIREPVGRQDAAYVLGSAFRCQQQRRGIWLSNRRLHRHLCRLGRCSPA